MVADCRRLLFLAGLALVFSELATVRAEEPGKQLFAVVVGSNHPGGTGLKALRYADDDAIRNFEVMRMLGAQGELLVSLDDDSDSKHKLVKRPLPASRAELRDALEKTFAKIEAAKSAGHDTEFFFWFSGHGMLRETEGVLFLDGGEAFTREDLYQYVLRASPARFNHVFIDACRAASFLSSRDDSPAPQVQREDPWGDALDTLSNVGVLYAATREGRVHEWATYEGGVFSFQLRSALLNAADVDADRRVSYLEAFAFLSAANHEVSSDKARMTIVMRVPDGGRTRVLADWNDKKPAASLTLPQGKGLHLRMTDGFGIPIIETNKDVADGATLVLPERDGYTLHDLPLDPTQGTEDYFALGRLRGAVALDVLLSGASPTGSMEPRGSDDIAPELEHGLFRAPYGRSYFRGIEAATRGQREFDNLRDKQAARRAVRLRRWGYGLLGATAASAIVAFASWLASDRAYGDYEDAAEPDRHKLKAKTRRLDWTTTGSLLATGAFALSAGGVAVGLMLNGAARTPHVERTASVRVTVRF